MQDEKDEEAVALLQRVHQDQTVVLGKAHFKTLESLGMLADLLRRVHRCKGGEGGGDALS
jgi:hypothetical protein